MEKKEIILDLGFIGHKAEKLQSLFSGYSQEPNENGFFLKFENHTCYAVNEGVQVWTNCFKSKKAFKKALFEKLLFNI